MRWDKNVVARNPNTTRPYIVDETQKNHRATVDRLRANKEAAEYTHTVLGFLCIEMFGSVQTRRDELTAHLAPNLLFSPRYSPMS